MSTTSEMIRAFVQGDHRCVGNIEDCSASGNDECIVCGARDCPCYFNEDQIKVIRETIKEQKDAGKL